MALVLLHTMEKELLILLGIESDAVTKLDSEQENAGGGRLISAF